ncbi:Alpha/Beta hydrolase protein [Ilyonectria sp. MPI-CAGE-AT-0026]|nr:Alpha/Beta hydrolase protein [Ilyonectria sp. MPI-CAGE-AT-0026]
MPRIVDVSENTFIQHPNSQLSHYRIDDFADPWKPRETILIQHGFARTIQHWYHWVPALARRYRVIRRDLRGHGLSSHRKTTSDNIDYEYSLDTILDEIIDTLDQLGIEKVHFLGESTSGMLGEVLAAKYPHRLLSLVICSSPTHLPESALQLFAFGHADWPTACRTLGSRGWAEALMRCPGTVASDDPAYQAWWLDMISQSDCEGLAGYAEFLAKMDSRPFLKEIIVPMLILAPSRSAVMTVAMMEDVAKQVNGAKIEVIDAPGHEIFVSGAEQCQKAAISFWESLEQDK